MYFLTLSIDIGTRDEDNVITMMTITMMMTVLITGMLVRHRLLTKIGGAAANFALVVGINRLQLVTSTTISMLWGAF